MTEVLWPLDLCPSSQTWNIIGNAATFTSPLSGATRTYGRPGARLGCTMTFPPMKGQDRARLLAVINTLLDRSNRVWVPDFSTTRRGSFPAQELLTNNDFSNGTAGWSGGPGGALSVTNRVARVTKTVAATEMNILRSSAPTVTQYAPYVGRGMVGGVSTSRLSGGLYIYSGTADAVDFESQLTTGMKVASVVALATSGNTYLYDNASSAAMAGDFFESPFLSLSRCALVDGGGNLLLRSDEINNAAWLKSDVTAGTNDATAPDGSATADVVVENSATSQHGVTQSASRTSGAADLCAYGHFKRATGTRNIRLTAGNDGLNYGSAIFDLGSGTVASVANVGTATNARAFMASAGGGWYYCAVVARLPSAATAQVFAQLTNGTTDSYTGDSTSSVAMWRVGIARSGVPTRGAQSTSTAVSASTQTGPGIYVKGLPPSTQGLLEAGDPVQIGGQLNFLTARLDSDAAGRGYLQCGRPWLAATNDAPVIVNTPMCKMILATDTIDLDTGLGRFSPFQIELVEAIE